MDTLSLRSKITGFSIAVLASVVGLAYTGYSAVDNMLALTKLETVNAAVRGQMELDMMHDAIKGDVQSATAAVTSRDAAGVAQASASLEEHKKNASEAIEKLVALPLSAEVKESIDTAEPLFKEYTGTATAFIDHAKDAATGDGTITAAVQDDFEKHFTQMEELLGDAGDKVLAWSKHIKDEGVATAASEQKTLLLVLTLAIGLAIILPIYMYVKVFKPLGRLVFISNALANEQYDVAIRETRRGDEIGTLAKALDTLRSKAAISFQLKNMVDEMPLNIITADAHNGFKISYANKASKQTLGGLQQHINVRAEEIEQHSIDIFHKDPKRIRDLLSVPGNLPHHAKITLGPETLDLKVSAMFDRKGNYVGPMLTWEVVTSRVKLANDFESSIGTVSSQVDSSATMLQERATSLQGAIEELSVSALEISKRVHDSLEIVRSAVSTGNEATSLTGQLAHSADRITSVVTLIRSIAEKTNLLALNATIESARAGDAGKGFAVVANEVKTLASQTANAIVEITTQISEIQAAANNTATAISQMTGIVQQVDAISTTIAGTVEEQQAATNEIARNISGMNDGNISNGVAASTIMGMASQLAEVSSHLQTQCDGFLQKVRAI